MTNQLIKIKMVREGYLPDYPYHLIADDEMCEAFLHPSQDTGMFFDYYPLQTPKLSSEYQELVDKIRSILKLYCLPKYHTSKLESIPVWVKSYMIGAVLSVNSNPLDVHELLVGLGCDNLDDAFTEEASLGCYQVSKMWLKKFPVSIADKRPPTMFGEPHIIKAIRLASGSGYTAEYEQTITDAVKGR